MRPTLPLALAYERAKGVDKDLLASLWNRSAGEDLNLAEVLTKTRELGAEERSRELLEAYKEEAIRSLWTLENPGVKGLLRRVIGKIFNETQIKGWCNEFEARNAPGREAGTAASA
jgi:geranylgeranyl pyrophosphate synthase